MVERVAKGQEVVLTQIDPGLKHVLVGLGWEAPAESGGHPVDLDASAFILRHDGKVRQDTDFVFYNNLETELGALKHLGDCRTGEVGGDDERIELNLDGLGFDVDRIVFAVTLHNAQERGETFGLVKNAYMRIIDKDTEQELARFDLTEDAAEENGFIFGEISRDIDGWRFKALGEGTTGGLYAIARGFGVNVAPN